MMQEVMANKHYAMKPAIDKYALDIVFFRGSHRSDLSPYQNGLMTRQEIAKVVDTEFIFFLDPDILLSPNSIPQLLEDFQKESNCGFMGIRYEPDTQHVMLGATVWRTAVFKEIGEWDGKGGCDCNFCQREVEKKGLSVKQHPHLMAYHYKHF